MNETSSKWKWHLVSLRYSFSYLAAAFLVSVPLHILFKDDNREGFIPFSLVYGAILGIAALIFLPFGNVEWKKVTVPRFKLFELGVARNATLIALGLLLGGLVLKEYFPPFNLAVIVLTLMAFSYIKGKAHRYLFREFYRLELETEDPPPPVEADVEDGVIGDRSGGER